MQVILLDTGPLVAYLGVEDSSHPWVRTFLSECHLPVLTCEAVITEACFLLRRQVGAIPLLFKSIQDKGLLVPFRLDEHAGRVAEIMEKYADLPASLADASLVCLSELYPDSMVATMDSHFRLYRRHRDQEIPLLMPA